MPHRPMSPLKVKYNLKLDHRIVIENRSMAMIIVSANIGISRRLKEAGLKIRM